MCGIVGYIGHREAEPILVEGLRRLEYRGYDSAGLATLTGPHLHLRKRAGRIADLVQYLSTRPVPGCHGISHTRWATHGPATDGNAHPHIGGEDAVHPDAAAGAAGLAGVRREHVVGCEGRDGSERSKRVVRPASRSRTNTSPGMLPFSTTNASLPLRLRSIASVCPTIRSCSVLIRCGRLISPLFMPRLRTKASGRRFMS